MKYDVLNRYFGRGEIQKQNLDKIKDMPAILDIKGDEFKYDYRKDTTNAVNEYYKDVYNGVVAREGFGEVRLSNSGIKSSYRHSKSQEKVAAYKAVPDIIKKGELTNIIPNRKNRGYDTYIFSAPINIGGKRYIGVVSVNKPIGSTTPYYYLHHVELEEAF